MKPFWESLWCVTEQMDLLPGCRCLSCWEQPTGKWQVDARYSDGPFVVGTQEEAEELARLLNWLEDVGREFSTVKER